MTHEVNLSIDKQKTTAHLWLIYTARAMGLSITQGQPKGNDIANSLDFTASLILMCLFVVGRPLSIYEIAKFKYLGSYKTVRRRLLRMQDSGWVRMTDDDRWELTDVAAASCSRFSEVMYDLSSRVDSFEEHGKTRTIPAADTAAAAE